VFWCIVSGIFVRVLARKMLNFRLKYLVDVEDVFGCNEYSVRVMGLANILPHCNASNLMLEILKHDKIWETICIIVPLQILGTRLPVPRNLRPWGLGLVHLLFVVDWHEKWKCSLQTIRLGCMQCDVRSMQCPLYAINLIHYTLILFHHYVYLF